MRSQKGTLFSIKTVLHQNEKGLLKESLKRFVRLRLLENLTFA